MISEGSFDTEDWSKFSFAIKGINCILKYIKTEKSCNNISQYYHFYCIFFYQINVVLVSILKKNIKKYLKIKKHYIILFLHFSHLADAFIQSDLQMIIYIYIIYIHTHRVYRSSYQGWWWMGLDLHPWTESRCQSWHMGRWDWGHSEFLLLLPISPLYCPTQQYCSTHNSDPETETQIFNNNQCHVSF